MKFSDIPHHRLKNQGISDRRFKTVKEAVAWMGAVQAQDYQASLWAVGLRVKNGTPKMVEDALAKGEIIRLSPMRSTIHFVAAEDARWMHALLTPRLTNMYDARSRSRGITPEVIKKAEKIVVKALKGGKCIQRAQLYKLFEDAGINTKDSLGLHLIGRLGQAGLVCHGPREGSQATMVLFDEWAPKGPTYTHDEAITELTLRYFSSHGPAQIKDLNWWSGLSVKDIKRGIELNGKKLTAEEIDGKMYYYASNQPKLKPDSSAHLLPAFDEYLVAYRDRDAALNQLHKHHLNPGANGIFTYVIVINGQVVGNWKRTITKFGVSVTTTPFEKFSAEDEKKIQKASGRYKKFIPA